MKNILLPMLLLILFSTLANSIEIEVKVPSDLGGRVNNFYINSSSDIVKFQAEFYNDGSVAYATRVRVDVVNNSQIVFTGWSDEKSFMPGDRKNFEIYWYTNSTGNFDLKVRSYLANEILENDYIMIKNASSISQDIFEIKNFRVYDDYAIFDVISKENVKDAVAIPFKFPVSWIFEQKKIGSIEKNGKETVVISFEQSVWTSEKLTLLIASDGGKYSTEMSFDLKKETGITRFIHSIVDSMKKFMSN